MKVEKLIIHRICVSVSCGCKVICDFKDSLCKDPFNPVETDHEPQADKKVPEAFKEYAICGKHKGDSGRSMLEFMIAERMEEAIADAQRQRPVLREVPVNKTGLEGDTVMSVATVVGGANRLRRPPGIKTMQRSPEALKQVGATVSPPKQEDVEVGSDEDNIQSLDQLLAGNDPSENKVAGRLDEGDEG